MAAKFSKIKKRKQRFILQKLTSAMQIRWMESTLLRISVYKSICFLVLVLVCALVFIKAYVFFFGLGFGMNVVFRRYTGFEWAEYFAACLHCCMFFFQQFFFSQIACIKIDSFCKLALLDFSMLFFIHSDMCLRWRLGNQWKSIVMHVNKNNRFSHRK